MEVSQAREIGQALTFSSFVARAQEVSREPLLSCAHLSSRELCFCIPQRGGRADALQNYLGQKRNPRLLLQIKFGKTRVYFRLSDLQKKPRSTVTIADPTTGLPHVYEGVSLEQLVPTGALNHESGSLEISEEYKQKVTIPCSDLDLKTTPLVADTDQRTAARKQCTWRAEKKDLPSLTVG